MDSNTTIFPFKFIYVAVLVAVCASASTVEKQIQGCSIEGIDLGVCLNQKNSSFSIDEACCKVLNKVVQTGFSCLCVLLASSFPLLTAPVSLPLSNCFITVPPLTLCKVLAPMPIMFPPNEVKQPHLRPPPPAVERSQFRRNPTDNNSFTDMDTQPSSSRNGTSVSPPKGMQIFSSSSSNDNPSPQPSNCLSTQTKKNETSKGSDENRIIRLHHVVLLLFLAL